MSDASFGFGDSSEDEEKQRHAMAVPGHAANSIGIELEEALMEALAASEPPMIWIGDGEWNREEFEQWFGAPVTLQEAFRLSSIDASGITEKFRRQIVITTELGKDADRALYRLACECEGIDPII